MIRELMRREKKDEETIYYVKNQFYTRTKNEIDG